MGILRGLARGIGASCAVAVLCSTSGRIAAAQAPPTPEYQLKAVFLYNFAQFVEWPSTAFVDAASPLVIGILGDDPFGAYLDGTVRGEQVNGHPLAVRRFQRVEDIRDCHILFVGEKNGKHLEAILDSLKGRSVLTVSDGERFASHGGMIGFVNDQRRIRLRINLAAARAADLTISSKLLRPAQIVSGGED